MFHAAGNTVTNHLSPASNCVNSWSLGCGGWDVPLERVERVGRRDLVHLGQEPLAVVHPAALVRALPGGGRGQEPRRGPRDDLVPGAEARRVRRGQHLLDVANGTTCDVEASEASARRPLGEFGIKVS